ncbi:uncharacterized protein LOC144474180 isoform X2 [Augochlora pura]
MENEKWYEILTRLLECPLCLMIPASSVLMCSTGHSLCDLCRRQLTNCPLCKSDFLEDTTRNFVAQDLISNLEQLKLCIEEGNQKESVNIKSQDDKSVQAVCTVSSVYTQTDIKKEKKCKLPSHVIKSYPYCMIGLCKYNDTYENLGEHLRHHHKQQLLEATQFSKVFPIKFLVHNKELPIFKDFGFLINDMVIIFFKFIIRKGYFKCCAVFISNGTSLPPLGYEVQIKSETCYEKYYGQKMYMSQIR